MNYPRTALAFAFASGTFFGGWAALKVLDSKAVPPGTTVYDAVPQQLIQPRPERSRE